MFVSKEIAKKRFEICKSCDKFKSLLSRCGECGCLMTMKVKFSSSSCPLNKWSIENTNFSEDYNID